VIEIVRRYFTTVLIPAVILAATGSLSAAALAKTITIELKTVCASAKSVKPPPAEGVNYIPLEYPDREMYRNIIGIIESARSLEMQNHYQRVPIAGERKQSTMMQLAIWMEIGSRKGQSKDEVSPAAIRDDLIKTIDLDIRDLSEEERITFDNGVDAIFMAADLTRKEGIKRGQDRQLIAQNRPGEQPYTEYDRAGRVIRSGDSSRTTRYDAAGRPIEVRDSQGDYTRTEYDRAGRVIRSGDSRTTRYDAAGRPIEVRDSQGDYTSDYTRTEYDRAGRVIQSHDASGQETRTEYDRAGRVIRSDSSTTRYDAAGRPIEVRDSQETPVDLPTEQLDKLLKNNDLSMILEGDGISTTMVKVKLTNNTDRQLRVQIPIYTAFIPDNPDYQTMISTHGEVVDLPPR